MENMEEDFISKGNKPINISTSTLILVILILSIFSSIPFILASVGYGEVGVKFNKLGEGVVMTSTFAEGWSLKPPWVSVYKYNTKMQEYTMSGVTGEGRKTEADRINALSKEGLTVGLDITTQYRIDGKDTPWIHKNIGTNYEAIILRPVVRSTIRDIASQYAAEDIYGEKRKEVESRIREILTPELKESRINLEDFLLRHVELPPQLTQAITAKMTAEQQIQEQDFNIDVESKLADQKRIEAQGIADANNIISNSLTNQYLAWYNIKNFKEHQSVVYLPMIGSNGYPEYTNYENKNSSAGLPFVLTKEIIDGYREIE